MRFDPIRVPLRVAGSVGLTFALLAGFESERALAADERARDDVTYRWMQRLGRRDPPSLRARGHRARAPRGGAGGRAPPRYPARDARGRGRLFVMNHRSMLDIFVTLAFFEANMVSRADLSGWPVMGLAARRVGTLFVDRSDKQSGAAVIRAMGDAVERGRGVMVYPEATTFAGDEVRPFRAGAFLAAARTGRRDRARGHRLRGRGRRVGRRRVLREPRAPYLLDAAASCRAGGR